MVPRYRQPRPYLRKTSKLRIRSPGNGSPGAIPTQSQRPVGDSLGIPQILKSNFGLGQPELLSLVQEDIAAQAHEKQHGELCPDDAIGRAHPPRYGPRSIVIRERPARPSRQTIVRPTLQHRADQRGRERFSVQEVESIGGMAQLVTRDEALHGGLAALPADLGNREAASIAVRKRTHALNKAHDVRM